MGKTILVTGANGSLGSAVVEKMVSAGYQVAAVTRESISHAGIMGFHQFKADLTNDLQVKTLVDEVYIQFNTIDAVVCTAGGFAAGSFETTGSKELDKMFAINFQTAYFLARHMLDRMLQQPHGGRFIFLGANSALDHSTAKNSIAYSFSKSLIFHLSELINEVGKGKKVSSYVIAPGTIDTEANRQSMPKADRRLWVSMEEIAAMIEYLCSAKGASVKSEVIKMFGNI